MTDSNPPEPSSHSDLPLPPDVGADSASVDSGSSWLAPIALGLVYLLFWQIAPRIRTDSLGAILTSTIIGLAIVLWFTARLARSLRTPRAMAINALLAAVVIVPHIVGTFTHHRFPPWSWLLSVPGLPELLLVWLAASCGGLLSLLLRGANMIPPVAAVLALVDIWTVLLGGPVQKLMQSDHPTAQAVVSSATVSVPRFRGATPFPVSAVVGFADFLFIAFFVAAIGRFVPDRSVYRRMVLTLIGVLCGYMLIVLIWQWSLPALLPMSVVMIALHWKHFHYERGEAFALLYAALFIGLIVAGFWYFGRRQAEPPPEEPDQNQPRAFIPKGLHRVAHCEPTRGYRLSG